MWRDTRTFPPQGTGLKDKKVRQHQEPCLQKTMHRDKPGTSGLSRLTGTSRSLSTVPTGNRLSAGNLPALEQSACWSLTLVKAQAGPRRDVRRPGTQTGTREGQGAKRGRRGKGSDVCRMTE